MRISDASFTQLYKRCLGSRDSEAWTELVRRLQPAFARIAYRTRVGWGRSDRRDIDDVVQEIFLKLGTLNREKLEAVPLESDPAALAYLHVLAANAARDYFAPNMPKSGGNTRQKRRGSGWLRSRLVEPHSTKPTGKF